MTTKEQISKPLRWGIIGAGRIARVFASDICWVEGTHVAAVASRSAQSAKNFAEAFAIEKHYDSYEALLSDPDIDAVYIATPHVFHYQQTEMALQHGKHVLCEKPITMTPEECAALFSLAKQKNCFLMEAMWSWFLPAICQAEKWLQQGKIGNLKEVRADFGYPMPFNPDDRTYNPALGGGCILDMGIYPLALNDLILQANSEYQQSAIPVPTTVDVYGQIAATGVEDEASIYYRYETDSSVIQSKLSTSFQTKLPNIAWVIGSEGYIEIPDFWRASSAKLWLGESCTESYKDDRSGSGFEFQIEHAMACISSGGFSPRVTEQISLSWQNQMDRLLKRLSVR